MTGDSAVFSGTVNPGGLATTVRFRWATGGSCSGGSEVFADQSPLPAGNDAVAVSAQAGGLTRGTAYTLCLTATNAQGSAQAIWLFTSPNTPAVIVNNPLQLSATKATLSAVADPRGNDATGWFRYGTTSPGAFCNDSFGTRVPISGGVSLGSGSTPVAWSQAVTGLTRATTYYVCAIAQNSAGLSFGSVSTVVTPFPVLDVDQNGVIDANTDGLLVVRYLLGLRGMALISGAIGANALRFDAPSIEAHLDALLK